MYKVEGIQGEWQVINTKTNAVQSAWVSRNDAFALVKTLNKPFRKEMEEITLVQK